MLPILIFEDPPFVNKIYLEIIRVCIEKYVN